MRLAPLIVCGIVAAGAAVAASPAAGAQRYFLVELPDYTMVTVRVHADSDVAMERVPGLPGKPVAEVDEPVPGTRLVKLRRPPRREPPRAREEEEEAERGGARRGRGRRAGAQEPRRGRARPRPRRRERARPSERRRRGRSPDAPRSQHVPDAVISRFRVPIFLLPIYQAAGRRYGIRWHILAAINEIETDYGRNLNVSSAGALGWMQFMPGTWAAYGVDANRDGRRDPYNPVDAIFAAARYLQASGYARDVRRAIFAYNHANWYVESVLLRARLIAGIPSGLFGSLSGLTEGSFPVAARARYGGRLGDGRSAPLRSIAVYARRGSPVVAVNDGVVRRLGEEPGLGRFVVLEDTHGNRYTYSGLGAVAQRYPWPRRPWDQLRAPGDGVHAVPRRRLFAHPYRPNARRAGGLEQILDARIAGKDGFAVYGNPYLRGFGTDALEARMKPLQTGSHVLEGTVLGRVGRAAPRRAAHMRFGIRPAGRGAGRVDPTPILDGWRLLESTGLYRASGRDRLGEAASLQQLLGMPKGLLERRVLSDSRIAIYPCGRADVRAGRIDRRVLVTLTYLAASGLRPTVSSLQCGHSYYTSSGNVSHHSSGAAVDIAMLNGVPVLGHQGRGGVTERAVRRLMSLQGRMRPAQIISLLDLGRNTVAMGDHHDHIHVGFSGSFRGGRARRPDPILGPGQWNDLVERLRRVRNPRVSTRASGHSLGG